jgi:hypothetical protein
MTSMNEAAIILKRDAGGRVVVVEQQRVDRIRQTEHRVEALASIRAVGIGYGSDE